MSVAVTEESGAGTLFEGDLGDQLQQQRCQSGEALAEWRSSDQVENGLPSTSPPYWDSDDDDYDDGGLKPSDLFGKYTWKIEKFSQINKRELRSNTFEVGGYKWYILIYPQGCDVCNHLSLFLCVANHDKLLPGWSHFAQFTIAVVNKDPKKSKYSDTLHRFWKKEHDWGWKKFMEQSKVLDGFIDADTLIIKAQVQVIRERVERPFRCLDCQYRRELVRVYLTNVEQICRRFVEECRGKLGKLIEDKDRWSSFSTFWRGMDENCKRSMSREKADTILKVVVKNFFIEKEVTSTLVMDSLYSGLRALEGQYKGKKFEGKYVEADELPVPIVQIEKEMFVMVDDVLPLLERAAVEPLPPKDDKGPQNRTKDGTVGDDFNKDSIVLDEMRLTELGRRTIEIFILAHVFNKIEVAYQEAVSLKKQEELIREEEAAWLAEAEHRAKRVAVDKEKKLKKKQAKQKRNNRKCKDKGKEDKSCSIAEDKIEHDIRVVKKKDSLPTDSQSLLEKLDTVEDVSDISDSVECVLEILPQESEDRDVSPVNWDTDTSEVHPPTEASSSGVSGLSNVQNGAEGRSLSVVDDSSSTCSSDSFPSTALSIPQKGSYHFQKNKKSPNRVKNQQSKLTSERSDCVKEAVQPSKAVVDTVYQVVNGSQSSKAVVPLSHHSFVDRVVTGAERQMAKNGDAGSSRKCGTKGVDVDVSGDRVASPPRSSSKSISSMASRKSDLKVSVAGEKSSSDRLNQADRSMREENLAVNAATFVPDMPKFANPIFSGKSTTHQLHEIEKPPIQPVTTDKPAMTSMPVISRAFVPPLTPGSIPAVSAVSVLPAAPIVARSVGLEPTAPNTQSHPPQSYLNAILGGATAGSLPSFPQNHPASSVVNTPVSYSQASALVSMPFFSPHNSDWMDPNQINPSFAFERAANRGRLQNGPLWLDSYQRESSRNLSDHRGSLNGMEDFDLYSSVRVTLQDHLQPGISSRSLGRQNPVLPDEFPHLDIINELLDDEHGVGNLALSDHPCNQSFSNGLHYLNRHFSFPGDAGMPLSSCRFERTRSYRDDVFQNGHGAAGAPQDALRNMIPLTSSRPYLNGPMDGLIPNQWHTASPDLSFLNARTTDNDVPPYHMVEYQNLTVDANGYAVFRPSNGF